MTFHDDENRTAGLRSFGSNRSRIGAAGAVLLETTLSFRIELRTLSSLGSAG
jgi:hypothetical protein